MKGHIKRKPQGMLALLLSVAMVVTCVPSTALTVHAETEQESVSENDETQPVTGETSSSDTAGEGNAIENPAQEDTPAGEEGGQNEKPAAEDESANSENPAGENDDKQETAPEENAGAEENGTPEETAEAETDPAAVEENAEEGAAFEEFESNPSYEYDDKLPAAVMFGFNDGELAEEITGWSNNFKFWDYDPDVSSAKLLFVNSSYHEAIEQSNSCEIPVYFGIQSSEVEENATVELAAEGTSWIKSIDPAESLKTLHYLEDDGETDYNYYKAVLHVENYLYNCGEEQAVKIKINDSELTVKGETVGTFTLTEVKLQLRYNVWDETDWKKKNGSDYDWQKFEDGITTLPADTRMRLDFGFKYRQESGLIGLVRVNGALTVDQDHIKSVSGAEDALDALSRTYGQKGEYYIFKVGSGEIYYPVVTVGRDGTGSIEVVAFDDDQQGILGRDFIVSSLPEYQMRQQKADGTPADAFLEQATDDQPLFAPNNNTFKFYLFNEKGEPITTGNYAVAAEEPAEGEMGYGFYGLLKWGDYGDERDLDRENFNVRRDDDGVYLEVNLQNIREFPFPASEQFELFMGFGIIEKGTNKLWTFDYRLKHEKEERIPGLFRIGWYYGDDWTAQQVVDSLADCYEDSCADYDNSLYTNPIDWDPNAETVPAYVRIRTSDSTQQNDDISVAVADGNSWIAGGGIETEYLGADSNDFSYYRIELPFNKNDEGKCGKVTVTDKTGSQTYSIYEMVPEVSVKVKDADSFGGWTAYDGTLRLNVGDTVRFRIVGSGAVNDPINCAVHFWDDQAGHIMLGYDENYNGGSFVNDTMFRAPDFGGNDAAEAAYKKLCDPYGGHGGNYYAIPYGNGSYWYPEFTIEKDGVANRIDVVHYNRYGRDAGGCSVTVSAFPELTLRQYDRTTHKPIGDKLVSVADPDDEFRNTLKIPADGMLRFYLCDADGALADLSEDSYKNLTFKNMDRAGEISDPGRVEGDIVLCPYGLPEEEEKPELRYTWNNETVDGHKYCYLQIDLSGTETPLEPDGWTNNGVVEDFRLADGTDLWMNLNLFDSGDYADAGLRFDFHYAFGNQIILTQEGNNGTELNPEERFFGFTATNAVLPPKDGIWKLNFNEMQSDSDGSRSFVQVTGVNPMESGYTPTVKLKFEKIVKNSADHDWIDIGSNVSMSTVSEATDPVYLQIDLNGITDKSETFDCLTDCYEITVTFDEGKVWSEGRTYRFRYYPVTVLGWNWNAQQYLDDELVTDLTSDQHLKITPNGRAFADENYCYKKDGSIDVYVRVLKDKVPEISVTETNDQWIGEGGSKVANWIKTLGTPKKVTMHESSCGTYDFYRVRLTGAGKNTLTRAGITVKVDDVEYDFTLEAARMLYSADGAEPAPILSNDQNQPTEVILESKKTAQLQLVTGGGLMTEGVIARLDDDMSRNDEAFKLAYDIPAEALAYWNKNYLEDYGCYYDTFFHESTGGIAIDDNEFKTYTDVESAGDWDNGREHYTYKLNGVEKYDLWLEMGHADHGDMDFAFTYEVDGVKKTYWPSVLATGKSVGDKLFSYFVFRDERDRDGDYGCQLRFNQASYTLRYEKDLEHDLNVSTVPIDVSGSEMKFYIYKNGSPLTIDAGTKVDFCEWRDNLFEIYYPSGSYDWNPFGSHANIHVKRDASGQVYYALDTAGLRAQAAEIGFDFAQFSYTLSIYSDIKLNDDENKWIMVNADVTTSPEKEAAVVYQDMGGENVKTAVVIKGGNAVVASSPNKIDVEMWNVNVNELDITKEVTVTSSNEEVAKCTKNILYAGDSKWNYNYFEPAELTIYKTGSTVISYTYTLIGGETRTVSFSLIVKPDTGAFHIVTFNSNGGSIVASQLVADGEKVTKPDDPTKAGAIFGGWYKDAECRTAWKFDTEVPTADMTLYAKWLEESITPGIEDVSDTYYDYTPEEQKALTDISAEIGTIKDKVYDGKPYLPTAKVTATVDGKKVTLTEGVDYGVLYKNNINAGTGEVIVVGNGLYKGEIKKEFTIKQKAMSKLKAVSGSMVKGATGKPSIAVYDGNMLLTEDIDYELVIPSDLTAKKATKKVDVKAKDGSNYTGVLKASVPIVDPKASEKLLTADDTEITLEFTSAVYSGKAYKPKVTSVKLKSDGTTLDNKKYSVKYTNNTNAGTAYVTIKGKSGYCGSIVTTFDITVPPTEIKLTKAIKTFTFNGKLQKPKPSVAADISDGRGGTKSKALKLNKDYVLLYRKNLHANSSAAADTDKAFVIVKGIGNYEGLSGEFPFTINTQQIKKAAVKGTKDALKLTYAKNTLKPGKDYSVEFGTVSGKKVEAKITGLGDFADSTVTKKVNLK